ncbi:MAG: T9SS type A sorting domain-containing protein [Flavobacterium sp.]|nr:T9SS type A sorting domain-containing protein [Flavobacterium sp.]
MRIFYFLVVLFLINGMNAQIVNIPDPNFKSILLLADSSNYQVAKDISGSFFKIDANSDGEIQNTEAEQVITLNISYNPITNLEGILSFTNLTILDCAGDSLTTLNVVGLTNLKEINCNYNHIPNLNVSGMPALERLRYISNQALSLNVSGCTGLKKLECFNNSGITALDVSGLTSLEELYTRSCSLAILNLTGCTSLKLIECEDNNLAALNTTGLISLENLRCDNNAFTSLTMSDLPNFNNLSCVFNEITTLNLSNLPALKNLAIGENNISSFDFSSFTNLEYVYCSNNNFTTLDFNGLPKINNITCQYNSNLTSLFFKNGKAETYQFFEYNPNLKYICCDDADLLQVQSRLNAYNMNYVHINSYCSFVPGGEYFTLQGNTKFDSDTNGCDPADIVLPNLKFSVTNGSNVGYFIQNQLGDYSIPLTSGSYSIAPVLENPTYFQIAPTLVNVAFPTQESPLTQDFCVTANGIHSDLEVSLMIIVGARPGFSSRYMITYRNKGNQIENGTVSLQFNDNQVDFTSANPTANPIADVLQWNFTNLQPFETRKIYFTMHINTPTDTWPVSAGTILNYTANITSFLTDEFPEDNQASIHQTVVNSFDPNDKTCMEGTSILPEMAGKYVHYVIRFENTGTANAENIVVKDIIDTTKFDITSLIPLDGSHTFTTRITGNNKVEFLFENIQLPFDNANNDGFVAFKIKTLPTLTTGDSFSNTASIYFDYNAPIVTNTATTILQVLGTSDFEFDNFFTLYPNPANAILNVKSKENIQISSVSIYNTLGQLVLVIPNPAEAIDVSKLTNGNYFVKINTDKGNASTRFVKR